jgi:hypothetical protein
VRRLQGLAKGWCKELVGDDDFFRGNSHDLPVAFDHNGLTQALVLSQCMLDALVHGAVNRFQKVDRSGALYWQCL